MRKLYSINFNYKEHLIKDIIEVICLGTVFYIVYLLFESIVLYGRLTIVSHLLVLLGLMLLLIMQVYITYKKEAKYSYDFYDDRIIFNGPKPKELFYSNIREMKIKRPILDQLFDTFTLEINNKWKMRGIHNPQAVYDYIQKLRVYSSRQP